MNLLTLVLAMLTATVATGAFGVAAFTLGHYGWPSVLLALGLGAFGAGALAWRIEAEIRRQDPAGDQLSDRARPMADLRPQGERHPLRPDPSGRRRP